MALNFQMAGFGGQGVMVMGQVLCYAGLDEGKNVSWFPSYGAAMRGGTANCQVVIDEEQPVGSPVFGESDVCVVMNNPSLRAFEKTVKAGGKLFINSTLVDEKPTRTDIEVYYIPGNEIAMDLGNPRIANMVMLGAMLERVKIVELDSIMKSLQEHLPERHHHLLPLNRKALDEGAAAAAK